MIQTATEYLGSVKQQTLNPRDWSSVNKGRFAPDQKWRNPVKSTQCRHEFPVQESLTDWFHRTAKLHPKSIALSLGDRRLTYAELDAMSNSLAHRLIAAGVKSESRVGICIDRSLEMVIAILGILKAGGAYVPLDPNYPQDRLDYMIRDAEIRVLVCEDETASRFSQFEDQLSIVQPSDPLAAKYDTPPHVTVPPDSAAYVIYTSGSTGLPKGCVLTHANVVRLFLTCESLYSFTNDDVWTLFHSISFDFSVWEIWGALLYGGRLVVVPFATSRSPKAFWNLLIEDGVTVLNQTPSAFRQLMQAEPEGSTDRNRLRYVIFGGEGLDPRVFRSWFDRHGDAKPELINMYGITETTVHVTYRKLTTRDAEIGGSPIGLPLPDLSIYLLDEDGSPVPLGVAGEIYVHGPGLARGYLNRPELTESRFVKAQFPKCPEGLLYRSGDLARWQDDGSLEFLGRIDKQVKVRGHRVELGEIEAVTGEYPGVATCAVIARGTGADDTRLVCYLVAEENATIPHGKLTHFLRQRLPIYMVPAAFVQIPSLPLTINGKLDKNALPDPATTRPELATEYVAPRNTVEETIANIWKAALGADRVGIFDNFMELGGDSLMSVRIAESINQAFPGKFHNDDLFSNVTIAGLMSGQCDSVTEEVSGKRRYLESIRTRGDATHLVIVGPTLRAPLESLPSQTSVWWLRQDGIHIWPPLGLDIKSEAAVYAEEVRRAIPSGKLILCGHSYAGLLAIELTNQLSDCPSYQIELVLLEPFEHPTKTFSARLRSWILQDQGKNVWQKITTLPLKFQKLLTRPHRLLSGIFGEDLTRRKSQNQPLPKAPPAEARFGLIVKDLLRNTTKYSIADPDVDYHIICRKKEIAATADEFNRLSHRRISVYELDDQLSHLEIALLDFDQTWISIVQKLCS